MLLAIKWSAMRAAEIRKSKGLSQIQLAEIVGVEQASISRFERGSGSVTLKVARKIAEALDVPLSDLFAEDRSAAEQALLDSFRRLPPERQRGWLDLAQVLVAEQRQ